MTSPQPPVEFPSVENFLPTWQSPVVAQLEKWKQGDLLERVGMTWVGPVGLDDITGEAHEGGDLAWAPMYSPDLQPRYAVVCSQTCDIGADGPGQRHPFVQVSPIVDLSERDAGQQRLIRRFECTYLVALTATHLDPGFWVADLRLSVPVSKALLLQQEPIEGFDTEPDRLNFAEALGLRLRRAALNGLLSEDLPKSLNSYLKSRLKNDMGEKSWLNHVSQVRIITTEDRLRARTVTIMVVEDIALSAGEQDVWRTWHKQHESEFAAKGLSIDKMLFRTLDGFTARQYKDSIPLRLPALAAAPTW